MALSFAVYPQFKTLTCYIFFILFEVLFYFIVMGTDARQYKFYWIVLAELILIPLYKMGEWNDFCMRGQSHHCFYLWYLCVQYLFDKNPPAKKDKNACCLSGNWIPDIFTEIQRNVSCTLSMSEDEYICDTIYSLGSIQLQNLDSIQLHLDQYIALDNVYEDSFFYQYLSDK